MLVTKTRNIILIGRTGSGKSALANVIRGANNFAESEYSVSETRLFQVEEFELEGIRYKIIDTVGIGDTKLSEEQVLNKLADAADEIKDGLNQILFVTCGKFEEKEIETYNLLRTIIFDADVVNYTTIVRTKFPSFRNPDKCQKDKEMLMSENEVIAEIIKKCNKFIHVNNLTEEEDPELKSRNECQNRLRTHLRINCQNIYRPKRLTDFNNQFGKYIEEKKKLQKLEDLTVQQARRLDELEEKIASGTKGFFETIGKAIDAAINAIANGAKNVVKGVTTNCNIM